MRIVAIFGLMAVLAAPAIAQTKEVIRMPGSLSGLPFSPAVRVGNLLFLSGQIGIMPGTRDLAPGGVGPETEQTMRNIQAVLEHAGSSLENVVKCTVFLGDMTKYGEMNAAYAQFFPTDPPARSTTGVSALALGAAVEIECIAVVGERG